jgi:dTDP-4-dehydrorhamnose 3,5-epimerase-like enzyme
MEFRILGVREAPLVALESGKNVPFRIKRVYYLFGTRKGISRGFHAHKNLQQILICVRGSCKVFLDDEKEKMQVSLDRPDTGVYVGRMVWREIHDLSDDCVILVLADDYYREDDYIRNHEEFSRLRSTHLRRSGAEL